MAGLGSYDYGDVSIKQSLQGRKMKKKPTMKGYEKADAKLDKKQGIKEGSNKDMLMDKAAMNPKTMKMKLGKFNGNSPQIMGMGVNKTNMRKKGKK